MRTMGLTAAVLLIAASGHAQDERARKADTEIAARVPLEQAVKGAPYSAEAVIEGMQQLADGNRIVRKTTGRVFRDSEGRTRREEDRPNGATMISITDPAAGYAYSLDAVNKVAWRTPMSAAGSIMRKLEAAPAEGGRKREHVRVKVKEVERPRVAFEERARVEAAGGGGEFVRTPLPSKVMAGPLEHKTLEGVAVEGRKSTTTIPAGQVGNEQPITITSEEWRAPDLKVLVLTRHSDPRSGDSSYRLQNIVRAEPDRSLFMVPPDFTIKDTGIRKMLEASRSKR